jgi:hypothetical protein
MKGRVALVHNTCSQPVRYHYPFFYITQSNNSRHLNMASDDPFLEVQAYGCPDRLSVRSS